MTTTEGVLSGTDMQALKEWLRTCQRTTSLEEVFTENASSVVGWFCLLIEEVERLNDLVEDYNVEADRIHVCPPEDERCGDFSCSHCWPSWICQTVCGEEGHDWFEWADDAPVYCERCGKVRQERVEVDFDHTYCWARFDETRGESSNHDMVELGDFRTDRGDLISRGNGRQMCRSCLVVEPPLSPPGEFLDDHGTAVPLDDPSSILMDPDECDHEVMKTYSSGWIRCLGCGLWVEPQPTCPSGETCNVIAVGSGPRGVIWCCTNCHQEYDSKPAANHPRKNAAPPEPTPDLPDPVGFVASGVVDGNNGCGDATIEDDSSDPFLHDGGNPCGLCGWSDPHSHQPNGSDASTAIPLTPPNPSLVGRLGRRARRLERRQAHHRLVQATLTLLAAQSARELPVGSNPVMRLESCFCCERQLDFSQGELTICASCTEDAEIAEAIEVSKQGKILAELFGLEIEVDHEDSPFTSELAYFQEHGLTQPPLLPLDFWDVGYGA